MPGVRGLSSPRAQLAGLISQAIFYGGNVLLSSIAVFLLETSKSRDRVTVWLSCFLLVMFGLSTAYLAILSHYIVEGSLSDASVVTASTPTGDRVSVWLTILLEDIICLLGDLIIIWRAWILWNRKHIYLIPPMILWLASLVAAVFETRANAIATHPDYAFVQRQGSSIWGIAFIMLTFSTNLTAALMVGWKYKSHRKDAAPYLMHRSRNNYILTLVVESGALYCITWIIKIIVWTSTTNGIYVLLPIITQLTVRPQFSATRFMTCSHSWCRRSILPWS
ncbi:hypothetical protein BDW22DRAFT_227832 [Trametopsis cervina]|nr:hypothetical protein BDW22DRAFT_227832 [Trametopsis cervina]